MQDKETGEQPLEKEQEFQLEGFSHINIKEFEEEM